MSTPDRCQLPLIAVGANHLCVVTRLFRELTETDGADLGSPTMPDNEDQAPLRAAIAQALAQSGLSQRELGAEVGHIEGVAAYQQQSVNGWLAGRARLEPRRVFAIERALRLRPGTLSKLDGYLPVGATPVVTVEEAIDADPDISSEQAAMLRVQLVEARRLTAERRARRSRR